MVFLFVDAGSSCGVEFGFFTRRHHCRYVWRVCGGVWSVWTCTCRQLQPKPGSLAIVLEYQSPWGLANRCLGECPCWIPLFISAILHSVRPTRWSNHSKCTSVQENRHTGVKQATAAMNRRHSGGARTLSPLLLLLCPCLFQSEAQKQHASWQADGTPHAQSALRKQVCPSRLHWDLVG